MKLTRRQFLKKGTGLLATLSFGGAVFGTDADSLLFAESAVSKPAVKDPILVVVQLSGGNDGLNTLIPYGAGEYYDARPTLGYKQSQVLAIDNQLGFHPKLKEMHRLYKEGKMAIIQGVGYPNPNRSHFRSMDIWQTAEPEKQYISGWLGRYVDLSKLSTPLPAIQIGDKANKALYTQRYDVPVIQSLGQFRVFNPKQASDDNGKLTQILKDIYNAPVKPEFLRVAAQRGKSAFIYAEAIESMASKYQPQVTYPDSKFASRMQLIAKLISGKSGTRVYYAELGGFDDHANEWQQHNRTLSDLDGSLSAFYKDLQAQQMNNNVVVMVFSEFGRRLRENSSGGTDHGTAAPVFVLGGNVKGGLYGAYPSLSKLDNGDLKYSVDFRSIYYTLIDSWLKGDAQGTLFKSYEKIPFI
ncbi:DUF1501 domain-containing protein [Paenibacillus sedimenti]|uniref:DUF1501 domain-containing protein n=1 Tax=Paenibacillus sedimenti TaxID=2770274 RepID=A0A926QHS1_9BACL|nr:DUF1501 domain-containing protein [Paenibacillus sedimenti]MBD0379795.1 DUF1501 domain-containing protein [Paenibacillus sedimenti]